jgi:hypothetical protein
MLQRIEMDKHVPLDDQLAEEVGAVTLINIFKVVPRTATPCSTPRPPTPHSSRPSHVSSPPSSTAASPAAGCS